MNATLARELLSSLDLPKEFNETVIADLELMARYKYDHYEMFAPGTRFFEHLYLWLKQFHSVEERRDAIEFVRRNLIFISQREMHDLARCLYFELVVPEIIQGIIEEKGLRPFDYAKAFHGYFRNYLRRCLFVGLSDGAQINFFRRHHIELSQEQVIPYYRADSQYCLDSLREETGDEEATFWGVFLIDDFTASGYTLIRPNETSQNSTETRTLEGALQRVYDLHESIIQGAKRVYVCHYISTEHAQQHVSKYLNEIVEQMPGYRDKLTTFAVLTLPSDIRVYAEAEDILLNRIAGMCERYYHESYETPNTLRLGGIKFGFGNRGLPLVLYSNTPNNTIYLLWVNPSAIAARPFHPLFRRIDRHRPKHKE